MEEKTRKKYRWILVVLIIIGSIPASCLLFERLIWCAEFNFATPHSMYRLVEFVLEAKQTGDTNLLQQLTSDAGYSDIQAMPDFRDQTFKGKDVDWSDFSGFNYLITLDDGRYFAISIDGFGWPCRCMLLPIGPSDAKIQESLKVQGTSDLLLPREVYRRFFELVIRSVEEEDDELLSKIASEETIQELKKLSPYIDQVESVWVSLDDNTDGGGIIYNTATDKNIWFDFTLEYINDDWPNNFPSGEITDQRLMEKLYFSSFEITYGLDTVP